MKKLILFFCVFALCAYAVTLTPLARLARVQAEISSNPATGAITAVRADAFYTNGQTDGVKFYADTDAAGNTLGWQRVSWAPGAPRDNGSAVPPVSIAVASTGGNVTLTELETFAAVKAFADWHKANP